jgi:hypothetical protein
MVDKLFLRSSGNYSVRVQSPLPLYSLNFNIFGLNLSEHFFRYQKEENKSKPILIGYLFH